jgi:prevent-host-death family protein
MAINIHEAKTHLSRLVDRAAAGEEIVIAKAGKPVAKLVPLGHDMTPRKLGQSAGEFWMAEDFDGPLPDELLRLFYGEDDPDPEDA